MAVIGYKHLPLVAWLGALILAIVAQGAIVINPASNEM